MWTMSNSRANTERPGSLWFSSMLLFASVALAQELSSQAVAPMAPDSPRPVPAQATEPPRATTYEVKRPVELKTVTVGRLTKQMETLAGSAFLEKAKDPLFLEVKTVPGVLGKPSLGAAPLIVLNGERLVNTRGTSPDTLVAFLPDREKIKETNSVAVVWIGKQEPTMTRKPLTFRRADVKE